MHKLATLQERIDTTTLKRTSNMSVVLGNSLLVQASLVLCFINSEVQTAFQLDQYGDVVFEDPVGTGELDYATEGRNGFCCISFRYLNLLCTQLVFIQSHLL